MRNGAARREELLREERNVPRNREKGEDRLIRVYGGDEERGEIRGRLRGMQVRARLEISLAFYA